jgi:DNA invertase Pin-like site-specific DNA recombinase
MYNNNPKPNNMRTEIFSKTEKQAMKRKLAQYGAIKECAEQTGIHRTTIARILKTGEATEEVAEKMRNYLKGESRVFLEE